MKKYQIDTSEDGKTWTVKGVFTEGDWSRFDLPFSADVALKEAKAYKEFFRDKVKHVRVIIEV